MNDARHHRAIPTRPLTRALAAALAAVLGACASTQALPPLPPSYAPTDPVLGATNASADGEPDRTLAPVVLDVADGIDPLESAYLALAGNPELRRARGDVRLESLALREAGVLPAPELSVGTALPVAGAAAGDGVAWSLGVAWEVTGGRGRSARTDAAAFAGDAVRLDIAWQEWSVVHDARMQATDVAALAAELELATADRDAERERSDALQALAAEGLVDRHAPEAAAQRVRDAEALVLAARADLDEAIRALGATLGMPAEATLRVVDARSLPALPPLAELLAHLDERRLDLRALQRLSGAASRAVVDAELRQFPPVGVGVGVDRDNAGLLAATLDLTVALPISHASGLAVERALDDVQRAEESQVARAEQARAEVAAAWTIADAWRARAALARQALDAARAVETTRSAELSAGLCARGDLDDARAEVRAATLAAAEADRQARRTTIAVETASGVLFDVYGASE